MNNKNLKKLDVQFDNKEFRNVIDPLEWNMNFKKIEEIVNNNTEVIDKVLYDDNLNDTARFEDHEHRIRTFENVETGTTNAPVSLMNYEPTAFVSSAFLWPLVIFSYKADAVRVKSVSLKTSVSTSVKFFKCIVTHDEEVEGSGTVTITKKLGTVTSSNNIASLELDDEWFFLNEYIFACTQGNYIPVANMGVSINNLPDVGSNTVYYSTPVGSTIPFKNYQKPSEGEVAIPSPLFSCETDSLTLKNLNAFTLDMTDRVRELENATRYLSTKELDLYLDVNDDIDSLGVIDLNGAKHLWKKTKELVDIDVEQINNQISALKEDVNNPPKINEETGNWMVWNAESNTYVDTGSPSTGSGDIEITPEQIKQAIDNYFEENPVSGTLPSVTADDNGKILRVVDGAWALELVADAEDGEF